MFYTDCMIDIETLGTVPGSTIISIGAVCFAENMPEQEWYKIDIGPISRRNSYWFTEDPSTIAWWERQSYPAKEVYDKSRTSELSIKNALKAFKDNLPVDLRIWSNGADFDIPLLNYAFRIVSLDSPWSHKNSRCYRTIKNQHLNISADASSGIKHNALEDALYQTRHLLKIVKMGGAHLG